MDIPFALYERHGVHVANPKRCAHVLVTCGTKNILKKTIEESWEHHNMSWEHGPCQSKS